MSNTIRHTVYDEEPDCNECDNCDIDSEYFCFRFCGPEHDWIGYERTVKLDE